ncbi:MAG: hypothetical protein COB67_05580 [SAR324 cluster bacterium]|uniref:Aminoglycoside phosphotransferase domain-containing protein n=1 Tax=SAR324 cluster bacterium TaxID=2024889 RepID=A0A2A4T547_9DELT|nr:MAG: hypothetical protein COB67_05580 [SAR324 cluster bacterium]
MIQDELRSLAQDYFNTDNLNIKLLQGDGSDRLIFRIFPEENKNESVIGVTHNDLRENQDFHQITEKMAELGLPVPDLYGESRTRQSYLQQDLGDWNLAELIDQWKEKGQAEKIVPAYKKVLALLPAIQQKLPTALAPFLSKKHMGKEAFQDDLRYCRQNFFQLLELDNFYTAELNQELQDKIVDHLVQLDGQYFVYRDFQSRNIMWRDDSPWLIDYQSALQGSLFYDLASLLYASRSGLNEEEREELLRYYFDLLEYPAPYADFLTHFYRFVLVRRLRSLGSYGYLSVKKGKRYFFKGIRPTLDELILLFSQKESLQEFTVLPKIIKELHAVWSDKEQQYSHLL